MKLTVEKKGKVLRIPSDLWVHYDGVQQKTVGDEILLEGKNEDSYLKILNHFGRVLKLYTFEDGRWLDADTELEPGVFDDSLAGKISPSSKPASTPKSDAKKAAKPPSKGKTNKTASGPATKTATKGPVKKAAPRSAQKTASVKTKAVPKIKGTEKAAGKTAGKSKK